MGEWVKCSERMPEPGKPVLVVSSMGGVVQHNLYRWGRTTWCDNRADYEEYGQGVFSHWMPLPEPPEV